MSGGGPGGGGGNCARAAPPGAVSTSAITIATRARRQRPDKVLIAKTSSFRQHDSALGLEIERHRKPARLEIEVDQRDPLPERVARRQGQVGGKA